MLTKILSILSGIFEILKMFVRYKEASKMAQQKEEYEKIHNDSSDAWVNDFGVRDERKGGGGNTPSST